MLSNVSVGLSRLRSDIGTVAHNPSDGSVNQESLRNLVTLYFRTDPPEKVTLASHPDKLKLPPKSNNGKEAKSRLGGSAVVLAKSDHVHELKIVVGRGQKFCNVVEAKE